MKTFYHATSKENLVDILENGLKAGYDGCVYMAEKEDEAVRFLAVRLVPEIVTFKIRIHKKDYDKIQETFDHNQRFFKCRAFGYFGNIEVKDIEASKVYENPFVKKDKVV